MSDQRPTITDLIAHLDQVMDATDPDRWESLTNYITSYMQARRKLVETCGLLQEWQDEWEDDEPTRVAGGPGCSKEPIKSSYA